MAGVGVMVNSRVLRAGMVRAFRAWQADVLERRCDGSHGDGMMSCGVTHSALGAMNWACAWHSLTVT